MGRFSCAHPDCERTFSNPYTRDNHHISEHFEIILSDYGENDKSTKEERISPDHHCRVYPCKRYRFNSRQRGMHERRTHGVDFQPYATRDVNGKYVCRIKNCYERFNNEQDRRDHENNTHQASSRLKTRGKTYANLDCPLPNCQHMSHSGRARLKHMKEEHPLFYDNHIDRTENGKFRCKRNGCSKIFGKMTDVLDHERKRHKYYEKDDDENNSGGILMISKRRKTPPNGSESGRAYKRRKRNQ